MSGVVNHRAVVGKALADLGLGWDAWPGVLADDRLAPDVRLSGLLVLLVSMESEAPTTFYFFTVGQEDDTLDTWGRPREPWERLQRMTLPWTALTATAAIESVTRANAYDERGVALALRGAKQVCEAGRADIGLLDALSVCLTRLDTVGDHESRIKEMRSLARRVVAAATPPDLLDLSLLAEGDAWSAPARQAAQEPPAQQVAALVRLLGELGPRKPSQRWLREVDQALTPPAAKLLLRRWLELAAHTDIVPEWPGSQIGDCLGTLFVGTNTDVVRAAVWATSRLPEEEWPAVLLGTLARRGAAHNGAVGFPEALALKVASAAVDTLIARGGAADRQVLDELLEDLQRRDLLKKVGTALGRAGDAAERDAELRRVKAQVQAVRRQADPAARKERAANDSLIRQRFGPGLRSHGFKGGPRTWRRLHGDRVDVITFDIWTHRGTGQARLDVHYGTRYDAVHPADDPCPFERAKIGEEHLDVRIVERSPEDDPLREDSLAASVVRMNDVVIPFLDTLGRYELAKAVLEHDAGLPASAEHLAGPTGSPARSMVLGLLGLAAEDKETALPGLQRAHALAQSALEGDSSSDGDSDAGAGLLGRQGRTGREAS